MYLFIVDKKKQELFWSAVSPPRTAAGGETDPYEFHNGNKSNVCGKRIYNLIFCIEFGVKPSACVFQLL